MTVPHISSSITLTPIPSEPNGTPMPSITTDNYFPTFDTFNTAYPALANELLATLGLDPQTLQHTRPYWADNAICLYPTPEDAARWEHDAGWHLDLTEPIDYTALGQDLLGEHDPSTGIQLTDGTVCVLTGWTGNIPPNPQDTISG